MSDGKKETIPKDEKNELAQESQESLESENDFHSALDYNDDQNDSIRKSVKFEDSSSNLEEIIEVVREEDDEDESERSKQIRLEFLPRSSLILDDQTLLPRAEPEDGGTLDSPKSEYQIEEQPSPTGSKHSMEAYQFVKRYSTSKFGEYGNALVTDAFVSFLFHFFCL